MKPALRRAAVRALRLGRPTPTALERRLRRSMRAARANRLDRREEDGVVWHTSDQVVHIQRPGETAPVRGVVLRGACDVPAAYLTAELVAPRLRGVYCVYGGGSGVSGSRADILLQTLEPLPVEATAEVSRRLHLHDDYFRPSLFEREFRVPGLGAAGAISADVVALSIGPNYGRTVYRHREHGFVVDPGGWWLNESVGAALADRDAARWFRSEFESAGRMSLEQYNRDMRRLIGEVQARTGAHVVVFNFLTFEPMSDIHTHQALRNPPILRARSMTLDLVDMSREMGFHIVDVERSLKRAGTQGQQDPAHYDERAQRVIAAEIHRVLEVLGVV